MAHAPAITVGLNAAIVAVTDETPIVLVVRGQGGAGEACGLPFGPFDPTLHRTLEIGLRTWVEEQTRLALGYVEQLYTFGDRGRFAIAETSAARVISVGYLALTRQASGEDAREGTWRGWYDFFPWEDWRDGRPTMLDRDVTPHLERWIARGSSPVKTQRRRDRVRLCFGSADLPWDEEKVLERYELLYEAGLVEESVRDQRARHGQTGPSGGIADPPVRLGEPMQFDHRRILATAMGRLRGKLKYRPVIFEVMPEAFTLLELQRAVEAISGIRLHKQNFRRLVEKAGLVEGTGEQTAKTGGRPAELFRFRREVLKERPAPGMRVAPRRAS
jgi:hypothetical protein